MKKHRLQREFFKELAKTPIVSSVCAKLNVSRQTYYRWLEEDPEFKIKCDESMKNGVNHVNDLAESKLIGGINRDEFKYITYWLNSRHRNYMIPRRPVNFLDKLIDEEVNSIEIKIISDKRDITMNPNKSAL